LRGERNGAIVAKLAGDAPLATGEQIALTAPASACHIFDAAGNAIDRTAAAQNPAPRKSSEIGR
jgi:multiple sugar transport system ATP-binding protein